MPEAAMTDVFQWLDGVRIGATNVYCDARRCPREAIAFVSHARAPRLSGPSDVRLITTERTRTLRALEVTPRGQAAATLVTPFGRPFALGRLRLELLPSGHVPGAAQLYVETDQSGGRRVAYCGPLNPEPSRFCETPQVRAAEALCIDAPLAPFLRRLPPRAESETALLAAVERALDAGQTPVVLAPALGASADVLALLGGAGLPLRAHPRIVAFAEAYARIGIALRVPTLKRFRGSPARGEAVVWPLESRNAPAIARLKNGRLFVAAGIALDPDCAARLRVDAAFALADHGDLPSLIAHARAAEARAVWLTSGFSDEVARAFAEEHIVAFPLSPRRAMQQMTLFPP
jgi:Cft2 family RNA processing exonuclease